MKDVYSTDCPKCDGAISLGIADLDGLEDDIEIEVANAHSAAYQDGQDDGHDKGYQSAKEDMPEPQPREAEFRLDLYRAIYRGDMEGAEDIANMMAMIDVDRDLIFQAKTEVRRG